MNNNHAISRSVFCFFPDAFHILFIFYWIKKPSSRRRALECLESSGTKIMSGPIVRQLYEWRTGLYEFFLLPFFPFLIKNVDTGSIIAI